MKRIKRIWRWINATRLRKLLSLTLAILIFFTSIKYIFIPAPKVSAADVYIKFDEGYGTAPSDSNSAISAGTITNAVWKQEDLCKTGKCLYFDGTGDYVSFADNANLDFGASNAFTLEGWFRTPDITSGQRTLIAKHNATAGGYKVYMDSSGYLVFGIDDDSTWTPDDTASTTTTAFDDNKWHFFSAVKTETAITIYVDGKAYQTDSSLAATATLANANTFYVGIDGNGSSNGFSGFLDEIRILKSAKTAAEVKADYTGLSTTTTGVGPVGWWKMDENTGTTSYDSSGNENTGTLTNGPTWSSGKFGTAVTFDGTDDYIESSSASLLFGGQVTVSAWINVTSPGATARKYVVNTTNGNQGYALTQSETTPTVKFSIGDGASYVYANGATTLTVGEWYFVTGTADSLGNVKIYVNGILDGSNTATGPMQTPSGVAFRLGTRSTSNYFNGKIDDVRVYNYQRNQQQILEDMQGYPPAGVSTSFGPDQSRLSDGLVGYWKMDETNWGTPSCSGTPILDSSGNDFHGDACPATTGPTGGIAGKFGKSGDFDEVNDYVLAGGSSKWSTLTNTTVSFWVKPDAVAGTAHILNNYASSTDQWGFRWTSTNFIQLYDDIDNAGYTGCQSSLTPGTWYHITGTINDNGDGTYKNQLYVNGVSQNCSHNSSASWSSYSGNLYIGASTSSSGFFNGTVDDVRIYNRSLSPDEISQLYNFAPGPVGYWNLDENTGTSANDSSGNGLTGTLTSGPVWNTGKFGSSLKFNTNQYIDVASSSSLGFTQPFTVSAWTYTDTSGATQTILSKDGNGSSTNRGYYLRYNSNGKINTGLYNDTGTACNSNPTLVTNISTTTWAINTWYYTTMVYDGSNVILYVNGIKEDTDATAGTNCVATTNFEIAARNGNGNPLNGGVDDVRIYNYVRTPSQIIEDMNGGHPAPGSPIGSSVAYWEFDEGYGTNANDRSVNRNDLTLSTASWTNSGKYGKAFNGLTNVRLSRADDADLDFAAADDATFSVWFKSDSATNPSANEYILEKGGNITTDAIGYAIYTSAASDGLICFGIDDDATSFPEDSVCSTNDLYDNTWHHIVAKKTGTSRLDLYVDGKANGTPDTSISATGTLENAATFYIGDTNGTDGTDEFLGDVDEVQVFRSALAADQVQSLYNNASSISLGSLSTDASNIASNSDTDSYCPPGQGSTCTPPVGEWKFDENTGTIAKDSSGNGNHGSISNPSVKFWGPGKNGSAMQTVNADGLASFADVADPAAGEALDFTNAQSYTTSVWVKTGTKENNIQIILYKGGNSNGETGYNIDINSSNQYQCHYADATVGTAREQAVSTKTDTDNQWHYVTCVMDRSGSVMGTVGLYIFVDGKLEGSDTTLTEGTSVNTRSIQFGETDATYEFASSIDDAVIYNYARTPAQIAWDMNKGKPVGWWELDENTGTTANDSAGNSTAGTLTNTPTWTTGKFNSGVVFAGSNQQILIADDSDFDFADDESMSVTGWFKHSAASAQEIILSKYAAAGYKVISEADGDITCGLDYDATWTPTDSVTSTLATYDDNSWHHIACVKNGATSLSLYIDGNLITTDSSLTATNTLTNADPLYLGIDADGTSNDYTGSLDDIRIYRYPLTIQQIRTVMNDAAAVKFTQ